MLVSRPAQVFRCVGLIASLLACCEAGAILLQRHSEDATPGMGYSRTVSLRSPVTGEYNALKYPV
ncbi:MAG: hypothetical protein LBJ01_00320 [Tannerella sp.]|nr:hypothetical protein [Tannerella sp.]